MPNYNTQGITSSAGSDPRNLGGSEGYGNPTASTSSGIMSSTANPTANDDNKDEPSFFESIANLFSGAGADLPSDKSDDDGDSGISFYDSPMFTPYDGGSDNDTTPQGGLPFETTAADRALYEALGVDVPEVYKGKMGEEEPEPNLDMDVLQSALQPEPITVEEIEVKAGDTLTAIAEEKGVPVQAVIDANPQIKNPDLIRPGEKVTLPGMISDMGKLLKTATDPEAPAPVSEDPDREFYQSGVPIEERVFEGAETGEGLMSKPLTDDDMGLPDSKVPAPDLAFIKNAGTNQGDNERSVYEYAYEQGLEGDELKSFMSQVAHESRTFGKLEEGGYTRANVNDISTARYKVGDTYKGQPLTAADPMVGKFKNINRRRMVRDGVTDSNGILQNYSADNVHNSMYAGRMGNGDFASGDGSRYKGRGYIQLTGRDNYRLIGEDIGEDLENNPELMLDPKIAEKASVAWWKRNVQTRQPDYTDVEAVTRIVNGGVNGLTDRRKKFNRYNETVTTPTRTPRPQARN